MRSVEVSCSQAIVPDTAVVSAARDSRAFLTGNRSIARIENGKVRLITRNNNDWTDKLLPLKRELERMKLPDGWYDGEIVVLGAGAMARISPNPFEAMTTITVKIVGQLTGDNDFASPETLVAFALGLTLFVLTLGLNVFALYIVRTYREQYE